MQKCGLTEEANRPNRGPGAGVMVEGDHGWVLVELRVRRHQHGDHWSQSDIL